MGTGTYEQHQKNANGFISYMVDEEFVHMVDPLGVQVGT